MAAILVVKEALRQAGAILLEPIMAVECVAPNEYRGGLLGEPPARVAAVTMLFTLRRGSDDGVACSQSRLRASKHSRPATSPGSG